ncbi:MAG: ferritin-like domain-containing protein, partial [Chloroflexota bacterium]|nr:ferritin-like domain-containing protein [Chloroflexota bacterium]
MTTTVDRMIRDALSRQFSRRDLFKGPVVAGIGALALSTIGGSFAAVNVAAGPLDSDLEILNYALTLEHLEAAAYKVINGSGALTGRAATYFQSFGQHEADHVAALIATIQKLGGTPVQPQPYNFSSVPKDQDGIVKFFQTVE